MHCWIPKATNTHTEYVIRIAFPWQQQLRERALMLRYMYNMYIACLVVHVRHSLYIVLVMKVHGVRWRVCCGGEGGAAGVAEQSEHRQCLELRQDTVSRDVISGYYATS